MCVCVCVRKRLFCVHVSDGLKTPAGGRGGQKKVCPELIYISAGHDSFQTSATILHVHARIRGGGGDNVLVLRQDLECISGFMQEGCEEKTNEVTKAQPEIK